MEHTLHSFDYNSVGKIYACFKANLIHKFYVQLANKHAVKMPYTQGNARLSFVVFIVSF